MVESKKKIASVNIIANEKNQRRVQRVEQAPRVIEDDDGDGIIIVHHYEKK